VPAGGLSLARTHWIQPGYRFFLPVKVLRRVFRAKFAAALKRNFRQGKLVVASSQVRAARQLFPVRFAGSRASRSRACFSRTRISPGARRSRRLDRETEVINRTDFAKELDCFAQRSATPLIEAFIALTTILNWRVWSQSATDRNMSTFVERFDTFAKLSGWAEHPMGYRFISFG